MKRFFILGVILLLNVMIFAQSEDSVVGAYQKVEDAVVGAYQKVEDKFVDTFLEDKK